MIFTDDRWVFPVCLSILGVENVPAQLPRAPCEPVVESREVLRRCGEIKSHIRLDGHFDAVGTRLQVRKAQERVVHARDGFLQVRRHTFDLSSVLMIRVSDASEELTKVRDPQFLAIAPTDKHFTAVHWQLGGIQSRRRGESDSVVVVSRGHELNSISSAYSAVAFCPGSTVSSPGRSTVGSNFTSTTSS